MMTYMYDDDDGDVMFQCIHDDDYFLCMDDEEMYDES